VYVKVYVNENLNTLPTRENVRVCNNFASRDSLSYQRLDTKRVSRQSRQNALQTDYEKVSMFMVIKCRLKNLSFFTYINQNLGGARCKFSNRNELLTNKMAKNIYEQK